MIVALLILAQAAGWHPPILEYRRANPDGSEAERILVYRPARNRVEVAKLRERCTSAAWVTGVVDRATGSTVSLSAGRLLPDAQRREVGVLRREAGSGRLAVTLGSGAEARRESIAIAPGPWHLYDFDLASLGAVLDGGPPPRRDIGFALPLVWNGEDAPPLRDLGRVTLRFERAERRGGVAALRYRAIGDTARFRGGPIWLDARDGRILAVRWGSPNHAEYTAFRLDLVKRRAGGAREWRRLLRAHFEACPGK